MFTSGGLLVIGGRDAKTNELLVKKYFEEGDLFFHADIVGAPAVIMKGGEKGGERDIKEAAAFAASYSRGWKEGFTSLPVFYVKFGQVSLSPPSGEYRPKGGIIVRGKREWVKGELRLYMGVDERVFVSAVKRGGVVFELTPGSMKREEAAKHIASQLNVDINDVYPLLPPGSIHLKKVV